MGGPRAAARAGGLEAPSGLRILRETPYLQHMGALVALTGAAAALSDYAFKAEAAAWLPDGAALLVTGDEPLRGTALEYLDNVLPEPIRRARQLYLAEERPRVPPRQPRPPQVLVEELRRSLG